MALVIALLVLAALLVAVHFILVQCIKVRRMAKVAESIPGPKPRPIVGNFLHFLNGKPLGTIKGFIEQYGTLFRMWIGPANLLVFVFDAKDVEVVMMAKETVNKPHIAYRLLEPVLGRGLVVINGNEHRHHRKLIQPTLHREMLDAFQPLMQNAALQLATNMEAKTATGEVFDVTQFCGWAAIDSAFLTILNADGSVFEETTLLRQEVVEKAPRMSMLLMRRVMQPWNHLECFYRWDTNYEEHGTTKALYDKLIYNVLGRKRNEKRASPAKGRRRALLDLLLQTDEGRSLSSDELFGELKTMVAASFVTSQDSLAVALLMLSLLPDVQAKIHQELDEVLGDQDRPMELADLDHLEYLERVIKETMRYYPSFAAIGRICTADLLLPSGHTLPAGCIVGLSPYATHHDPKYFPDPQRFDPDRWLPEEVAKRPVGSFIGFSLGPRNCIGARYAIIFLKTQLACVLRRLVVLPDPDGAKDIQRIRMLVGVTFYPKDGAHIRVQPRRPRTAEPASAG